MSYMESNPYNLAVSHLFIWTGKHACYLYSAYPRKVVIKLHNKTVFRFFLLFLMTNAQITTEDSAILITTSMSKSAKQCRNLS